VNATTWVQDKGVTPEFETRLMAWRQKLFDTLAGGLAAIVIAGFAGVTTVVFFLMAMRLACEISAIVTVVLLTLGLTLLDVTVPAVARERPKLET
jgi:hypothetical protein